MDATKNMGRRDALKGIGLGVAACVLCKFAPDAHADEKKATRPPGTCEKWMDKPLDGICNQSQKEEEPCLMATCPGNKLFPSRKNMKKNGAPDNVCGQWMDPEKSGSCMVSIRDVLRCNYKTCPAHIKHA